MDKTKNITVTDNYFGGEAGIKNILKGFYENQLRQLSPGEENRARIFIEEGLIVKGKRVLISEGVEQETFDIEESLLNKLLDTRLIREENTHLGKSYEISHDSMVEPIVESLTKRKKIEEKVASDAKLKEANRKSRRNAALAITGFLLMAIAVGQSFRLNKSNNALVEINVELKESNDKLNESSKEIESITNLRYLEYENNAKLLLNEGNYEEAKLKFVGTYAIKPSTEIADFIEQCEQLIKNKNNVNEMILIADDYFREKEYHMALVTITNAERIAKSKPVKALIMNRQLRYLDAAYFYFKERINAAWIIQRDGKDCEIAIKEIKSIERLIPFLDLDKNASELGTIDRIKVLCKNK